MVREDFQAILIKPSHASAREEVKDLREDLLKGTLGRQRDLKRQNGEDCFYKVRYNGLNMNYK